MKKIQDLDVLFKWAILVPNYVALLTDAAFIEEHRL